MRLFKCPICGNVVELITDGGGILVCCGKKMEEQIINSSEDTFEKHIPEVRKDGNKITVKIGSTLHPMVTNHYIEWITLVDEKGSIKKTLKPEQEPVIEFETTSDKFTIYTYCNIHGFYKTEY